jgi:hypothetical protein
MLLEEKYVNFICNNDLTQGQFLLLYLVYKNRLDLVKKYKETYPTQDGTMIGQLWIDKLFQKEWLIKNGNKTEVSIKFREQFCDKIDIAEELILLYPSTMEIEGKIVPLTAVDVMEFADLYYMKILGSQAEHLDILKDIKYGIENNMLNISIKKFVQSSYWKALRKKRVASIDDTHESKQHKSFG